MTWYDMLAGRVGDGNTIARVSVTPNSFQEQIIVMPTSQPRFAYVALASKGCTFKVHAPDFKLLFLNPGNDQFGVDEMGTLLLEAWCGMRPLTSTRLQA